MHYTHVSELPIPARWVYGTMLPRWDGGPVQVDDTLDEGDAVGDFEVVHLPGPRPVWSAQYAPPPASMRSARQPHTRA